MTKSLFLFTSLLLISIFTIGQNNAASLLTQAEQLRQQNKEAEALSKYKEALRYEPQNLNALTNASLFSSREGFRKSGDEKIKYYKEGKAFAERALKVSPSNAEANFVMAVAMGRIAEISDTREKIAASKDIKKYAEAALRADKTHAGAWHILGKWNYGVKDLGTAKTFIINMVYGGLPEASFEKAVECYNKAINYNNDYILYYYDLALAYEKLGQKQNALTILNKAIKISPSNIDDPKYLKQCREMIGRLKS